MPSSDDDKYPPSKKAKSRAASDNDEEVPDANGRAVTPTTTTAVGPTKDAMSDADPSKDDMDIDSKPPKKDKEREGGDGGGKRREREKERDDSDRRVRDDRERERRRGDSKERRERERSRSRRRSSVDRDRERRRDRSRSRGGGDRDRRDRDRDRDHERERDRDRERRRDDSRTRRRSRSRDYYNRRRRDSDSDDSERRRRRRRDEKSPRRTRYDSESDDERRRKRRDEEPRTATAAKNAPAWASKSSEPLNEDQTARLEKAKAYAAQQTATLRPPVTILPLPANIVPTNPAGVAAAAALALQAGQEQRNILVISRIYVGSINFDLNEEHMKAVFSQFGWVKNVSMTMDAATGKHKGFCFVEYEVPEAAELALQTMNGVDLGGRTLKVGRPNNYNPQLIATFPPAPAERIYISNVNPLVAEGDLAPIFEVFGPIKSIALMPDPVTRKHKGCGYIELETEEAAKLAIQSLNGFEIAGMQLRVTKTMIGGPMPAGMSSIDKIAAPAAPAPAALPAAVLSAASAINTSIAAKAGSGTGTAQSSAAGVLAAVNKAAAAAAAAAAANAEESLEDNAHISSTNQRFEIMRKLQESRTSSLAAQAQAATSTSNVLLLENAATIEEVDDDLKEEMAEECGKYGKVSKIVINTDKSSGSGEPVVRIYIQFADNEGANKGKAALDGRWFGGRRVSATLYSKEKFEKGDV